MNCPYCGFGEWYISNTRPDKEKNLVRRTRECKVCALRVTTEETIVSEHEPERFGAWYDRRQRRLNGE